MSDTSNPEPAYVGVDEAALRFPSLASLRAAHSNLLKQHREHGSTPEFLAEIAAFIRLGSATGALLDVDQDRWACQSLLDYWATMTYRAGSEPPDATLAEFDPMLAPSLDDSLCPYLGLDAFREDKQVVFFGRKRLVDEMVARLKQDRLLAVVGLSGSGKSSVTLAGLVPALKGGVIPGSQEWNYLPSMVPGSNPLANLARILRPLDVSAAEWDLRQGACFQEEPSCLARLLSESRTPAVLVVDQFEELFTLCRDESVRKAFIDNLLGLLRVPEPQHVVVLTMRADFEPQLPHLGEFQLLFEKAEVHVMPMSAGELREAIEKPAEIVGLRFEQGVVDNLLSDILGEDAALPLLQFTLLKLWERRVRNRITWAAYQELGGGREALARSADEFYVGLIPQDQRTARNILLRMVRPGEVGREFTSNRIRRESLYKDAEARVWIDPVLDKLIHARLVRLTQGDTPGDDQIQVAHEALVRNWPRLGDWLEDERETIRQRLRLTASAEQWAARNKTPELLLPETLLVEVRGYQDLNELEYEYIRASEQALESAREKELANQLALARAVARAEAEHQRAEEQARDKRRLRRLTVALVIVATLAAVAALVAAIQWQQSAMHAADALVAQGIADARLAQVVAVQATSQAERAGAERARRETRSQRLAALAKDNLDTDPERSILLALHAVSATYLADQSVTREAQSALREAIQTSHVIRTFSNHTDTVRSVVFSPDGTRLATASIDKTARVWDVATGKELLALTNHTNTVNSVAFSPDGMRLATASADRTARVWDTTTGRELLALTGHTGTVNSVAFSPDGTRLATASADRTTKVWDAVSGQMLFSLSNLTATVTGVAFAPDGVHLATADSIGAVKLWDALSRQVVLTLTGHTSLVSGIAYSPNGKHLASAGQDRTVRVWDVDSGKGQLIIDSFDRPVLAVAFSADGTRLATASADNLAKVWDASTRRELFVYPGHSGSVMAVAFSPDGKLLATASADHKAKLWDADPKDELLTFFRHAGQITSIVFSADGKLLATTGTDTVAKVWDATAGKEVDKYSVSVGTLAGIAFSSDGKRMAVARADRTVSVLDSGSGQLSPTLAGYSASARAIAFHPDGTQLAVAYSDGTIKTWDTNDGQVLRTLVGHTSSINGIAYSPDGKQFTTASTDRTARVWDTASGRSLFTLTGHNGSVNGIAYSKDGKRLATASSDRTAIVRDVASGQILFTVDSYSGASGGIAFSPDGQQFAFTSSDGAVRVWDTSTQTELFSLSRQAIGFTSVAFSPDGKRLVVGGTDGVARVYISDIQELVSLACRRATRNLLYPEWRDFFGPDELFQRTCPELPVDSSVIQSLTEQAQGLVRTGEITRALAVLSQTATLGPTPALVPRAELARMQGQLYARQGKADDALAAYRAAVGLDTSLRLVPETEVAKGLVELGEGYIRQREITSALSTLDTISLLDPSQRPMLATDIARALVGQWQSYRGGGDTDKALRELRQAVELAPEVERTMTTTVARAYNQVCWWGSLDGQAAKVLSVCEQAVKLSLGNTNYRDSRGLARALTGDYAGAIDDFRSYVADRSAAAATDINVIKRGLWIKELEAGRNPFDEATLKDLR